MRLGISRLSPEQMDKKLENNPDLAQQLVGPIVTDTRVTRSGESSNDAIELTQEFFKRVCHPSREVVLQEEEINFGGSSHLRSGIKQNVHVTNNTGAKIVCCWRMPGSEDGDNEADFSVFPESQEIGP